MLQLEVRCPYCETSLMDTETTINGQPSIALEAGFDGKRSKINLSAMYGNSEKIDQTNAQDGDIVCFYCPHCGKELKVNSNCLKCGAPMVQFQLLKVKGIGEICSRKGCTSHCIKFREIENEIKDFYDTFNLGENKENYDQKG